MAFQSALVGGYRLDANRLQGVKGNAQIQRRQRRCRAMGRPPRDPLGPGCQGDDADGGQFVEQGQARVDAQLSVGRLPGQVLAHGAGQFRAAEAWKALYGPANQVDVCLGEQALTDPERWIVP